MSDFLDSKLKEIRDRVTELRPLVDEFRRLEAAERTLSGLDGDVSSDPVGRRPARSRRASGAARTKSERRPGRRKGGGARSAQALELVKKRPGITIPELAEAMGIQQNYLYRVMPGLAEEGHVIKSGRGWHLRKRDASDDDAPPA